MNLNVKSNAVRGCRPLVSFFKDSSLVKQKPNSQNAVIVLSKFASLVISLFQAPQYSMYTSI